MKRMNPETLLILLSYLPLFPSCVLSILVQTSSNKSNVCSFGEEKSCLHQIRTKKPGDICTAIRTSNSSIREDSQVEFSLFGHQSFPRLGFHLEVYRHKVATPTFGLARLPRTSFNVSFQGHVRRHLEFCFRDPSLEHSTVCITYNLKLSERDQNVNLYYDCLFRNRRFEGNPYRLDYNIDDNSGWVDFNVPSEEKLDLNPVFIYLHSLINGRPVITFQVNTYEVDEYILDIVKWDDNTSSMVETKVVNISESSTLLLRWNNLVTVQFETELSSGNFSITASCLNPSCSLLSTPFFVVKDSAFPIFAFLFSVTGSIALLGGSIYAYMMYFRKIKRDGSTVSLLLLYDPISRYHVNQVKDLQRYLAKVVGLEVYLDIVDVPNTEHMDPVKWYATKMIQASYVGVVIPPAEDLESPGSASIYQDTFPLALQLMSYRMKSNLKSIFLILLENSSVKRIPEVCLPLKKFTLPDETRKLKLFVKNPGKKIHRWQPKHEDLMFTEENKDCLDETFLSNPENVKTLINGLDHSSKTEEGCIDAEEDFDDFCGSVKDIRFYGDKEDIEDESEDLNEDEVEYEYEYDEVKAALANTELTLKKFSSTSY